MVYKRITQLDGLRVVMCLYVVASHLNFNNSINDNLFLYYLTNNGSFAVDVFFILSGFCLYLKYKTSIETFNCSIIEGIKFAQNKFIKIYPAYFFSLLLCLPNTIIKYINTNRSDYWLLYQFFLLILCILIIQSIFISSSISQAFNNPCWYLSTLYIVYMFCPFLLKMSKRIKTNSFVCYIITFFLIIVSLEINYAIGIKDFLILTIDSLNYCNPFLRCLYVLLGMFLCKIYLDINNKKANNDIIIIFIIAVHVLSFFYLNEFLNRIVNIVVASFYIVMLSCGNGYICKIIEGKFINFLSKYILLVYLFHFPAKRLVENIFDIICVPIDNAVLINILILLLMGFYIIIYKIFVETNKMQQRFIEKHVLEKN